MQRGVETLDTYLKLLLQVLELRYIASLLFAIRKSCGIRIRCIYIQEQQRKPFYTCPVRTGINAKELNQDEPFCKSIHPKRKVRRPFVSVFSPFPCWFQKEKKKEKKEKETTVDMNPVRLPKQQCSLARFLLSAPLLLLVLGIRQLIPQLDTLPRSP